MLPQASVEKRIQFDSIEELLGILGEAAEIEHGLMCCYLYALWGLKTRGDDGLNVDELAVVRRWRKSILDVAIEEMAHLALVSNVMCALGLRPHFRRQNFPVSPGYHPADIAVALAPFDLNTLDNFIFLERPEGIAEQDGKSFIAKQKYVRGSEIKNLTPVEHDYAIVGHLYRSIAEGIKTLCAAHGESNVFCGHKAAQIGPDIVQLPGLMIIDSLETALLAIGKIVEQGEGAPEHSEDSHYQGFLNIRYEYEAILAKNPSFIPSRLIARNPVMRRPPVPEGRRARCGGTA